jgi:thioredoxin-like negative regulator of GroEL
MKPIVHGLEQQFQGRLDVLYFDISDEKYHDVQRQLKFSKTPHFILLRPDGERVREWTGIVPEAEMKAALESLVDQKK